MVPGTYIVLNDNLTVVTVAAPGAIAGATSIPVNALTQRLYPGYTLIFSSGHTATITANAAVGDTTIAVGALANAIGTGETTYAPTYLTNGKPSPADRFANWVTQTKPIGDSAVQQSNGGVSMFVYRTDYGASFELSGIPVTKVSGERLVEYADRLIASLLSGGNCYVSTGDVDGNAYAACGLMPGTTPSLTLTDRVNLEYTLRLSLINLAASPTRMVCHYV